MKQLLMFFASLTLIFFSATSNAQTAGTLDVIFGIGGKVMTDFSGGDEYANAIALQADGKIVAVGYFDDPGVTLSFGYGIVRYNVDGSLDNSFGNGGIVKTTDFGSGEANSVKIQPDGKIVVAGTCYLAASTGRDFGLARYNVDGSLDNTFGNSGIVITDFSPGSTADDNGLGMALQPDGKIVVVGGSQTSSGYNTYAIARYNTDGSLDNTFGTNGQVRTSVGDDHDQANCVAIEPGGNILVAGYSYSNFSFQPRLSIIRLSPDGSFDNSFGNSGIRFTSIDDASWATAVDVQADGKIVVGGMAGNTVNAATTAIVRYTPSGSLDNTFNGNGEVTNAIGSSGERCSIALQSDGKILAAGTIWSSFDSEYDFGLVRLKTDGTRDSSFGTNGIVRTDFAIGSGANDIALQPDGKIILAGYATLNTTGDDFALARYFHEEPTAVSNVNTNVTDFLAYPNPFEQKMTLRYTLKSDEVVSIYLTDVTGKIVETVFSTGIQQAGTKEFEIELFQELSSGLYCITLCTPHGNSTLTMRKR